MPILPTEPSSYHWEWKDNPWTKKYGESNVRSRRLWKSFFCPPTLVPLPVAILKMGKVLFPDAWTGEEDMARPYINRCTEPVPPRCPEDLIEDASGIGPIDPESQGNVRYVHKDGGSEIVSYEKAVQLWVADKGALFEAWKSEGAAWERWHTAANELRSRLCCDGIHSILLTDEGARIPREQKHWESYFGEQMFSPLSGNFSYKLDMDGKEVSTRCFLLKERFSDLIAIELAEAPFDTPWWNQTMALAWVYHRDKDLVRLASERGEHNDYHWPDIALPNELEDQSKMGFDEIMRDHINEIFLSPGAAHDKLRHHLMAGEIEAWGRKDDGGDLSSIPAVQWSGLKFYFGNPPYVGPIDHTRVDATSWYDVQFKRSEILDNWQDTEVENASDSVLPEERPRAPKKSGTVPVGYRRLDTVFDEYCDAAGLCELSEKLIAKLPKQSTKDGLIDGSSPPKEELSGVEGKKWLEDHAEYSKRNKELEQAFLMILQAGVLQGLLKDKADGRFEKIDCEYWLDDFRASSCLGNGHYMAPEARYRSHPDDDPSHNDGKQVLISDENYQAWRQASNQKGIRIAQNGQLSESPGEGSSMVQQGRARPLAFSDFEFFTFKRLAVAWVESQQDVPKLTFEEIYGLIWRALWEGTFDGSITHFIQSGGGEWVQSKSSDRTELRYNKNDLAQRGIFGDAIRKFHGMKEIPDSFSEEECKGVPVSALMSGDFTVFSHENFGIRRSDFTERWLLSGKELPWFLGDSGEEGESDALNERVLELEIKQSGTAKEVGRPKNSYSLEESDAPLVQRMHCLLKTEKSLGSSIMRAAGKVVGDAAGDGSEESRAKRLQRRYTKKYGNGA